MEIKAKEKQDEAIVLIARESLSRSIFKILASVYNKFM